MPANKPNGLAPEGVPDAAQLRSVLWGTTNDRHLPVNQLYPAHLSARGSSV
jgi:hypothetical protein